MKCGWITLLLCLLGFEVSAQSMDLSGTWHFAIDRTDVGVSEKWYSITLSDSIVLPGSMPERLKGDDISVSTQWVGGIYDSSYFFNPHMEKYRVEGKMKLPFFLTPDKYYKGVAWYQKEVSVPAYWKGERITLYLERPHIESSVWVDNRKVGVRNSMSVAHEYDLTTFVTPGKRCRISVRVDNRLETTINVGPDSHSVTDQTQGNWNGIVGKIELRTTPSCFFDDIQAYPDLAEKKAVVKINVYASTAVKGNIVLSAESFNTLDNHRVPKVEKLVTLRKGDNHIEIDYLMGDEFLTWDEFSPALYRLTAQLKYGKTVVEKDVQFGMREFKIKGKWFYVNGRKTQLRGTVDCCIFPETGYAPMDVVSWEKVYRICKEYGLNHVRFHSWCPPEAAFIAADKVGMYLQAEGPSWPNHGVRLGNGEPIDKYLMDETIALTKAYGNYASYCMLASGNEPYGNWVKWVTDFVEYWEKTDSRRVYTGASVGNSWQWQPRNQYHVKAGARGLNWKSERPESMSDYRARIDTVSQPYVAHENGQWCVFPNFEEIYKYTGVNKAKNFEIFRDILSDNNMADMGHKFLMASGKLQTLCYKHELEKTLRTPDYAGFQMLGLNDYSGQGSALVGVIDAHFEEKGYVSAAEFRRFCSSIVPLARIPKFVYTNDEVFEAELEVSQFGNEELKNVETTYTIKDENGILYGGGSLGTKDLPIGDNVPLGNVRFALSTIERPTKLNLEVRINGTDAVNDWDFWVYPSKVNIQSGDVYVTATFDKRAMEVLHDGGKVLITAAGKVSYGKNIVQHFTPVFWNTSWFKMRHPHTTGIWVNEHHPLFDLFPTEYHSNLQWWELLNKAQVMQFTQFPDDFQPLVQSIDTWFLSRKIGMLFEANVLNGRLMMTSMDITRDLDKRIVARQMRKAVLDYMNSDKFRPTMRVEPEQIEELFTRQSDDVKLYTNDSPDELKPTNKTK